MKTHGLEVFYTTISIVWSIQRRILALKKIKEAEMLLGRPQSTLKLALWELYPELSTDSLRFGCVPCLGFAWQGR